MYGYFLSYLFRLIKKQKPDRCWHLVLCYSTANLFKGHFSRSLNFELILRLQVAHWFHKTIFSTDMDAIHMPHIGTCRRRMDIHRWTGVPHAWWVVYSNCFNSSVSWLLFHQFWIQFGHDLALCHRMSCFCYIL